MYTRNTTQREDDSDPLRYTPDFFFLSCVVFTTTWCSFYPEAMNSETTELPHNLCFVNKFQCFTELFFGDSYQDHLLSSITDWISSIFHRPTTHWLTAVCKQKCNTKFCPSREFVSHNKKIISCCCRRTHIHSTPSSWDEWKASCETERTTSAMFEKVRQLLHCEMEIHFRKNCSTSFSLFAGA